jgi:drug/metabolite transporter (DMT)-like permease
VIAAALAIGASLAWGVGDFLGGLKARSLPALSVIACSQPFGLAVLAVVVAVRGRAAPGWSLAWACLSALLGTTGLFSFYRGLAAGAMAVVAPIAGAAAIVPVAFGLATGERPGALRELGFVLAIGGVVLTSREPRTQRLRLAAGAGWGLLAMAAFGGYYVPLHEASRGDFLWASLVFRSTSVTLAWTALLLLRPRIPVLRPHLPALVAVGVLDTGGNVCFAAASTRGLISVVSVLASLYPVGTVLLARATLHERIARIQELGVVATLAGVALISAG